jgi:hypothetical protein
MEFGLYFQILANFAVKIPTFSRISSITAGGTSESTFRIMMASSPCRMPRRSSVSGEEIIRIFIWWIGKESVRTRCFPRRSQCSVL